MYWFKIAYCPYKGSGNVGANVVQNLQYKTSALLTVVQVMLEFLNPAVATLLNVPCVVEWHSTALLA